MSFLPLTKSTTRFAEDFRPTKGEACLAHMGLDWASAIVYVLVAAASCTEANQDQQQAKQFRSRKLQQVICSSNCHVQTCLVCDGFCCLPLLSSLQRCVLKWTSGSPAANMMQVCIKLHIITRMRLTEMLGYVVSIMTIKSAAGHLCP